MGRSVPSRAPGGPPLSEGAGENVGVLPHRRQGGSSCAGRHRRLSFQAPVRLCSPGQVFRGPGLRDVIGLETEEPPEGTEPLLRTVMRDGARAGAPDDLCAARARFEADLWASCADTSRVKERCVFDRTSLGPWTARRREASRAESPSGPVASSRRRRGTGSLGSNASPGVGKTSSLLSVGGSSVIADPVARSHRADRRGARGGGPRSSVRRRAARGRCPSPCRSS